jgi:hypothetical protein
MGFVPANVSSEKSRMQILACIKAELLEKAAEGLKTADGLMIEVSASAEIKAVEKFCQSEDGIPVGRWLKEITDKPAKKTQDSACDFIVFNSAGLVGLTRNDKIGRILEFDLDLEEGLIRAAGEMPVDGILVSPPSLVGLTIKDLMLIQRTLNLVNKPVVVCVSPAITLDELQSLWDIGICGLAVEVDDKSASSLAEIRQKINDLKPPAFRKKARLTALISQSQAAQPEPEEDDGEEEEDE